MALRIWICDDDEASLEGLRKAFEDFRPAGFFYFKKLPEVLHLPTLDAVYLSPPYAERWGARPIFYQAEVLRTTPDERAKGMVPYVVSGVMMRPDDDRKPPSQVQLLMECVLEAVVLFNRQNSDAIENLGFLARNIAFRPLEPSEVARIVKQAYQEKLLAA